MLQLVIAMEIGLEPDSVITGLLHNIMYAGLDRKVSQKEIEEQFGNSVYSILEGMTKINALGTDTVELHPENYRKLLLALAGDVRVIILKIADRLQVMRHMDLYSEESQKRLVSETAHLYAPLAHRLGIVQHQFRTAGFMPQIPKSGSIRICGAPAERNRKRA